MPNHVRTDRVVSRRPRPPRAIVTLAALTIVAVAASLFLLVGSATRRTAAAAPAEAPSITRYFGRGAFDGIRRAAATTPRNCTLSDNDLTALVMAPIFKEVSMAETPDAVPSPMTLSRYDEWTGVRSGSNNLHANYGLYAFRDPNGSPYRRAYWHPGIGIFQYDSAGVGAPYTAAEMVNVEYIARDVAAGMAQRYCVAGGDGAQRRAAAWQPWGALGGIAKSEALFQEMLGGRVDPFSRIGLVDGVENTGGMVQRECLVAGAPVTCWYIDPGRAQGARWWATADPGGGAVTSGMAPLSAPFYVVKRSVSVEDRRDHGAAGGGRAGGFEERHWISEDTGYPVDVAARRRLGQNARPKDGQPGSGLEWFGASALCDPARPAMGCSPPPTPEPPPPKPAAPKPFGGFPMFEPFGAVVAVPRPEADE